MDRKAGGFPLGGSLEFARGIEKRYLGLGGKVRYNSRVVKITETSGRATGVELENGERVTADYVISAADMKRTLFSMLDGTRLDPLHKLLFDDPRLYPPCVLVNFGVNMDFTPYGDRGIWEFLRLEKPVELAGKTYTWLNVHNYAFDPSLAPEHKTVAQTYLPSDGSYWERFRNDQASYSAEKDRIAAICADRIEERYPGFKARIEMTDVATPLTFEQYS